MRCVLCKKARVLMRSVLCKKAMRNEAKSFMFSRKKVLMRCVLCKKARVLLMRCV